MRHPHHRAIAAAFVLHGIVTGSLVTRMPWIQDNLGLDPAMLGLALFCPPLGALLTMPTAGRLAHRLGARTALRVLLPLHCAALALPALAPGLGGLCLAMFLLGAGAGAVDVVMNAQGVEVERRIGRSVMAGLHGMWSVGNFAGAGVGVLAGHVGLDARVHHAVMAALLAAAAVPALRGVPVGRPAPEEQVPPRFALPSKAVLVIGLVGVCAMAAELSTMQWAAIHTIAVTGASEAVGAGAYAAFAGSMMLARFAGDAIIARLGPVRAVRYAAALATLGTAVVAAGRVPAVTLTGFALFGVGMAVVVPLVFAAAGNAGRDTATGVAGVGTMTYLAGMAAPGVSGWLAEATSFPFVFWVFAVFTTMIGLLAGALRPAAAPRAVPVPAGKG
ncbi:MFS transporter [Nonomuraea sp. MCN248]|uniref:MFS transporter n=1 Tax=Nonomuraea corallina TaxID=2989783 RepID=A0ABT4SGI9_9ACTN|nr:MFS transporter [Nonomuraea corallina]MDA0636235.1 MFS transporter [Nonomuraea corallina]